MKAAVRLILGLFALLYVVPAHASLQFYVAPEDTQHRLARILANGGQFLVYVSGSIEAGDTERFASFITRNNVTDALVILNSPGGSLMESLKFGQFVRNRHFDTDVGAQGNWSNSICASACSYIFAGGVYRYLENHSGKLGIHQFSSASGTTGEIGDIQLLSGAVVEYLEEMGVDARAFSLATTVSPNEIVWVTPTQALNLRLANNGTLPTTAEIKTIDMYPYLRLEQVGRHGDIKVMLICGKKGLMVQAGITASAEGVGMNAEISKRSYLEFDDVEALVEGAGAVKPENDVLWLIRGMPLTTARKFGTANKLGVWSEGGGAVRFGGYVSLAEVRDPINRYLDDCASFARKASR